jgi:hypothetical protein
MEKNLTPYLPGLFLSQFEVLCHYNLIKSLLKPLTKNASKPKYGCENGFKSFVSIGYCQDASVFLFESIKHFSILAPEAINSFTDHPLFPELVIMRNNIHTYFKKGGFSEKTKCITESKLKEYKLDKVNFLSFLRNDVSLVFHIKNQSRHLIGSDNYISHCIYESENKNWKGSDYRNFAEFLASSIMGIASTVDEMPYQLPELTFFEQMPLIELFDYKSADLANCSAVTPNSTFRLLLILYQISYILILIEDIADYERIVQDDLWACFIIKLIAIKYDESFDNLYSLLRFSTEEDKLCLKEYCMKEELCFDNLKARTFAQNLRNTLHYQNLALDINSVS